MEAKDYMSRREIANLFECLMTGLMYHRPEDYVDYMIDCLNKIKDVGIDTVRWDMFLEAKRSKTPLPPISATNGFSREASMERESSEKELKSSTPLPPIASTPTEGKAPASTAAAESDALGAKVPIFIVVGGPGSAKGQYCDALVKQFPPGLVHISTGGLLREKAGPEHKKAIDSGELLPDDVVISILLEELKPTSKQAKGVLLTGFPRTKSQITMLEEKIGNVVQVLLIDYEEDDIVFTLERRRAEGGRPDDEESASARRIANFKEQTLPVCKHFEDAGKLILIDGNRSRDVIIDDLARALQPQFGEPTPVPVKFSAPRPPSVPRPSQRRPSPWEQNTEVTEEKEKVEEFGGLRIRCIQPDAKDTGRKEGLFSAPIVLLMGGPGSGRSTQAAKLVEHYGFAYLAVDSDGDIIQKVLDLGADTKGLLLEGYPHSEKTLNDFNREIGGGTIAVLIDCFEDTLRERSLAQNRSQEQVDEDIQRFKEETLSVVRYLDLEGVLSTVLGSQTVDEVFAEITKIIDEKLNQAASEAPAEAEAAPEASEAPAESETAPEATEAPAESETAPEVAEAPAEADSAPEATEAPVEATEDAAPAEATEAPAGDEDTTKEVVIHRKYLLHSRNWLTSHFSHLSAVSANDSVHLRTWLRLLSETLIVERKKN